MRYLMMVKASGLTEAGIGTSREYAAKMRSYRHDLKQAGVLLAHEELQPSSAGLRVGYPTGGGEAEVCPGPFSIDQGLLAGFLLMDVDTEEEALQWALRMPVPAGQEAYEIELRKLEDRLEQPRDPRQAAMELELKNYLRM